MGELFNILREPMIKYIEPCRFNFLSSSTKTNNIQYNYTSKLIEFSSNTILYSVKKYRSLPPSFYSLLNDVPIKIRSSLGQAVHPPFEKFS